MRHTICSGATGLYDLGMYDQNGNSAGDNLKFPFELFLEPANRTLAATPAGSNYTTELWKLLGAVCVGTKLFNVKCARSPGVRWSRLVGSILPLSAQTVSMQIGASHSSILESRMT